MKSIRAKNLIKFKLNFVKSLNFYCRNLSIAHPPTERKIFPHVEQIIKCLFIIQKKFSQEA